MTLDESAMTPAELCAALRISRRTYYDYQRRGLLDRFRLVPTIGDPRYSRKAVRDYLDREPPARTLRAAAR